MKLISGMANAQCVILSLAMSLVLLSFSAPLLSHQTKEECMGAKKDESLNKQLFFNHRDLRRHALCMSSVGAAHNSRHLVFPVDSFKNGFYEDHKRVSYDKRKEFEVSSKLDLYTFDFSGHDYSYDLREFEKTKNSDLTDVVNLAFMAHIWKRVLVEKVSFDALTEGYGKAVFQGVVDSSKSVAYIVDFKNKKNMHYDYIPPYIMSDLSTDVQQREASIGLSQSRYGHTNKAAFEAAEEEGISSLDVLKGILRPDFDSENFQLEMQSAMQEALQEVQEVGSGASRGVMELFSDKVIRKDIDLKCKRTLDRLKNKIEASGLWDESVQFMAEKQLDIAMPMEKARYFLSIWTEILNGQGGDSEKAARQFADMIGTQLSEYLSLGQRRVLVVVCPYEDSVSEREAFSYPHVDESTLQRMFEQAYGGGAPRGESGL